MPMHRPSSRLLACSLWVAAVIGLTGCDTKSSPTAPIPPLSRVVVSPDVDTLRVGEIASFSATAYDTLGNPVPSVSFQWSSGDRGIFSVNGTGRVLGIGDGTAP